MLHSDNLFYVVFSVCLCFCFFDFVFFFKISTRINSAPFIRDTLSVRTPLNPDERLSRARRHHRFQPRGRGRQERSWAVRWSARTPLWRQTGDRMDNCSKTTLTANTFGNVTADRIFKMRYFFNSHCGVSLWSPTEKRESNTLPTPEVVCSVLTSAGFWWSHLRPRVTQSLPRAWAQRVHSCIEYVYTVCWKEKFIFKTCTFFFSFWAICCLKTTTGACVKSHRLERWFSNWGGGRGPSWGVGGVKRPWMTKGKWWSGTKLNEYDVCPGKWCWPLFHWGSTLILFYWLLSRSLVMIH